MVVNISKSGRIGDRSMLILYRSSRSILALAISQLSFD